MIYVDEKERNENFSRRNIAGRPASLTEEQIDEIITHYNAGATYKELMQLTGRSRSTLYRIIKERTIPAYKK